MSLSSQQNTLPEDAPHVLIVDDDRRIRTLLQNYLSDQGFRVSTADSAAEARRHVEGLSFDLIVLDVMMPGETGFELTQYLRCTFKMPILLLTARDEPKYRIEGLELGADDYLTKPFEPKELLLRISNILKRVQAEKALQPNEVNFGSCVFNIERGELRCADELVHLTSREKDLLRLFAANPGDVFSRLDLAEPGAMGGERSVDVLINRLRRKIRDNSKTPLYLQTVRGAGYVLYPDS